MPSSHSWALYEDEASSAATRGLLHILVWAVGPPGVPAPPVLGVSPTGPRHAHGWATHSDRLPHLLPAADGRQTLKFARKCASGTSSSLSWPWWPTTKWCVCGSKGRRGTRRVCRSGAPERTRGPLPGAPGVAAASCPQVLGAMCSLDAPSHARPFQRSVEPARDMQTDTQGV